MRGILGLLVALLFVVAPAAWAAECVECHTKDTPNIVADLNLSKHHDNGVDCSACHGAEHSSAADVAAVSLPTPDTCAGCHEERVAQYRKGKHTKAWLAMSVMPTTHNLPSDLVAGQKGCGGCHKIGEKSAEDIQKLKAERMTYGASACDSCHTRHMFRPERPRNPRRVRPATWVSTIPNGRCTPRQSTGCGTC